MSDPRFGHFGVPALLLAGAGLLALILHLAVPYAHVDPRAEDADSFTLDQGEAARFHSGQDLAGSSSPGLTLAGCIIMLVAGLALAGFSYAPLTVTPGRWIGWSLAAL